MSKDLHLIFAVAGLLVYSTGQLRSQDSLKIVILSERVGREVDAAEHERFRVFSQIKGFRKAVVLRAADGKYFVQFDVIGPGNTATQMVVEYSEATLFMIAEKINHFEEAVDGKYVWGSDRPTLDVVGGKSVTWKELEEKHAVSSGGLSQRPDLFPFYANEPPEQPEPFPRLSFRTGISTSASDFGGIQQLVTTVEDHYREQGYPVRESSVDPKLGPLLWFSLGLDLAPAFGLTLETSTALGGDCTMKTVAASVVYRPSFLGSNAFRPYVGAGVLSTFFSIEQVYLHSDRVSPVDSTDGYSVLAAIGVQGKTRKGGGLVTIGFEWREKVSASFAVQAFARYLLVPPMTVTSSYGETRDISLRGFVLGGSLALYF